MWQKRGVAILINRTVFPQKKIIQDKKGRCVMAVGSIGETELYILNLNAQNEDDYGLFKEIELEIEIEPIQKTILRNILT